MSTSVKQAGATDRVSFTRSSSPVRGADEDTKRNIFASGGVLGALAMTSCCIAPLVLFSLGATGAWIGSLSALYPYKWYMFVLTAGFLGSGFYMVYRKRPAEECAEGTFCAAPLSDRLNKIALWIATSVAVAAMTFSYVAPVILDM